jgi:uncharacterized lipoprotein YmbA
MSPGFLSLWLFAVFTTLGVTGCVNLGKGTAQSTRFYTLSAVSSADADANRKANANSFSLGIGPVKIPKYLDRPQIVTRINSNEYYVEEFARWSEPLGENVTRVLAENLSALVPTERIALHPFNRWTLVDYQITVDIMQFEAVRGGDVMLTASWNIVGDAGNKLLVARKSRFEAPTGSEEYGAMAASMSATLADLSREIAEAIAKVALRNRK